MSDYYEKPTLKKKSKRFNRSSSEWSDDSSTRRAMREVRYRRRNHHDIYDEDDVWIDADVTDEAMSHKNNRWSEAKESWGRR
ncbi:MAG: hypothetical protein GFH27_549357n69 [Chloroflexi bacterium AL-W]|nr:hypothetical protein [Chloroflexi bacterium AL-N10]NOK78525.1 hypothetical protein [Chloroflexi bacterium AL-N5]NOK85609.1 hypothetical protein [Chloroflexi bacterium AL-W]NOK92523.1 hypothetical protein [Chloroflexi bacterium AL-N15]